MFVKKSKGRDLKKLLRLLSAAARDYSDEGFVAFVYFLDGNEARVKKLNKRYELDNIGLCVLSNEERENTLKKYKINPQAKSTVIVYKEREVKDNIVNFKRRKHSRKLQKAIVEICK